MLIIGGRESDRSWCKRLLTTVIHIGRMPIAPKKTAGADQAHNPMRDACGIVDAQEHAP